MMKPVIIAVRNGDSMASSPSTQSVLQGFIQVPLAIWLGNALGLSMLASPLDYLFSVLAMLIWLVLLDVIAVLSSLLPAQQAARLTIRGTLAYVG